MIKKTIITHRFIKNEDLNHHGTLYAGRCAEWFIESGLLAAAYFLPPENIVCVKLHGMKFSKPVRLGVALRFESRIAYAGKSSLVAHVRVVLEEEEILHGFISFVNVDGEGKAFPHGLTLENLSEEEKQLEAQAREVHRKRD